MLDERGVAYVCGTDAKLHAIDAEGNERWATALGAECRVDAGARPRRQHPGRDGRRTPWPSRPDGTERAATTGARSRMTRSWTRPA
jgi:hypothetical protein